MSHLYNFFGEVVENIKGLKVLIQKSTCLLSIIIPTYNRPAYVAEVLLHIDGLRKNGLDCEVVLIDSSATDETKEIASQYDFVKYVWFEAGDDINKIIWKFNIGLNLATGVYSMYLADDDQLIEAEIKKALDVLINNLNIISYEAPFQYYDNIAKENLHWIYRYTQNRSFNKNQKLDLIKEVVINRNFMEIRIARTDILLTVYINILDIFRFYPLMDKLYTLLHFGDVYTSTEPFYLHRFTGEPQANKQLAEAGAFFSQNRIYYWMISDFLRQGDNEKYRQELIDMLWIADYLSFEDYKLEDLDLNNLQEAFNLMNLIYLQKPYLVSLQDIIDFDSKYLMDFVAETLEKNFHTVGSYSKISLWGFKEPINLKNIVFSSMDENESKDMAFIVPTYKMKEKIFEKYDALKLNQVIVLEDLMNILKLQPEEVSCAHREELI